MPRSNLETASLAGGCFWCTEAVFNRLKGVTIVTSGYSGGKDPPAGGPSPTYEEVCSGQTGHAETIQIGFNPKVISFEKILEIFFKLHDPTTLNRQEADIGTQYRSVIFYHDQKQKSTAEKTKQKVEKTGEYSGKIVTEIIPFTAFYKAEPNHQNFYEKNKGQQYCQIVIDPKLEKLYKNFSGIVESEIV